jgi:UDP-N-acetylmuramate: L-alanyl-gamma-D-glutamyl-meso-diaminopimelate ligase
MGALAGMLRAAGHEVRGSDVALYPPMSDQLRALKIPVAEGFCADNLAWGPDRVVVGNTCSKDHVEVVEAERLGLPMTSLPAVLGEEFLAHRHPIVVAGTHGKTTTTSLIAHVLDAAGRSPGFFIGGVPIRLGRGWQLGEGPEFVVEGDEYDSAFFDKGSKFLHYRPQTAVLTSVELDHVDIFRTMDEVRAAFARFVELLPPDGLLLVASSSAEALAIAASHARCRVETYACGDRAVGDDPVIWHADRVESIGGGRARFEVTCAGEPLGSFETGLFGDHNTENLLAAIAVCRHRGLAVDEIRRGIGGFAGVRRRQEVRAIAQGVFVIDDYAHHPTAIAETLHALRRRFQRRRIVAVYEPRSASSRRRTFQRDYVDALMHADEVVIGRLYRPEAIPEDQRLDPKQLALELHQKGTPGAYIEDVGDIVRHLAAQVRPGDVVVVFSSGSFDGLHDRLVHALGDAVTPAIPADIGPIRALLEATGLERQDIEEEDYAKFLVLRTEHGIVGCIGLEVYGEEAILRSLAVYPSARGHGYGWMLAGHCVDYARTLGVRRIHLLTPVTASDFFAQKLGFRVVDVSTVADAVASSKTFRLLRSRSPMTMRLDL